MLIERCVIVSNHSGSYLINETLQILDNDKVFELLGKEKTLQLLLKIKSLGFEYDCNDGEILDEIGEKLNICYTCWQYKDHLDCGICEECCPRHG